MPIALGLFLVFFPRLIAGTIVLTNRFVWRRDIAHRRESLVRGTRWAGYACLGLTALYMILELLIMKK